jgi:hypothetical protein
MVLFYLVGVWGENADTNLHRSRRFETRNDKGKAKARILHVVQGRLFGRVVCKVCGRSGFAIRWLW